MKNAKWKIIVTWASGEIREQFARTGPDHDRAIELLRAMRTTGQVKDFKTKKVVQV